MYSLAELLLACAAIAAVTGTTTWLASRVRAANQLAEQQQRHEDQMRTLREEYAADLRELQHSLTSEVADLRERMRRPLRQLVDNLLG
jgi:hypothetical protein